MNDGICYDIDECVSKKRRCKNFQYCVNLEGSYQCKKCHSACHNCTEQGPFRCIQCSHGYVKNEDRMCERKFFFRKFKI